MVADLKLMDIQSFVRGPSRLEVQAHALFDGNSICLAPSIT